MAYELLTPAEMARADRLAIAAGPFDGQRLMENAGVAVAAAVLAGMGSAARFDVLCGPGNNGGDGYVVARLLAQQGAAVTVWREGPPRAGSDAAHAAALWGGEMRPLAGFLPMADSAVVDALFGAGLSKPLEGAAARAVAAVNGSGLPVVAIDLPSGLSGETGRVLGSAFRATTTVTFFRKKPGHVLYPGRDHCGRTIVADIGIPAQVLEEIAPAVWENGPWLWSDRIPRLAQETYKYARGHVAVFSGGPSATGAARLAALGAARAGAGAVTMLSPAAALMVNAAQLTSVILRKCESMEDTRVFLAERRPQALVFGPGLTPQAKVGDFAIGLIGEPKLASASIVLDADAITSLARQPETFFAAARRDGAPRLVLTPHEGEFARLFPDIAGGGTSKLEKARQAAARANATIIYKGPDTVIAAPDGRAAININGTPLLATAGSGDVLAGISAGLLAQGMPPFEACCAAVWLHAEAARRFGVGLIAEDLPAALVPVLQAI